MSSAYFYRLKCFHILGLRQNGRHFPHNIFTCIFWNENVCHYLKQWWLDYGRMNAPLRLNELSHLNIRALARALP